MLPSLSSSWTGDRRAGGLLLTALLFANSVHGRAMDVQYRAAAAHDPITQALGAPFREVLVPTTTRSPDEISKGRKFADAFSQMVQIVASTQTGLPAEPVITAAPEVQSAPTPAVNGAVHNLSDVPFIMSDPSHTDIVAFSGISEAPEGIPKPTSCCTFDTKSFTPPQATGVQDEPPASTDLTSPQDPVFSMAEPPDATESATTLPTKNRITVPPSAAPQTQSSLAGKSTVPKSFLLLLILFVISICRF